MEKENKTKQSQIKASIEYDKRKGNTTIACKVTQNQKELIQKAACESGMKSINAYILNILKNEIDGF